MFPLSCASKLTVSAPERDNGMRDVDVIVGRSPNSEIAELLTKRKNSVNQHFNKYE